jgi:hypothetical protein
MYYFFCKGETPPKEEGKKVATTTFTSDEVISAFAQTNNGKKIYEATFGLKSVPSEVHEQIVQEVTESYDKFTEEFAMPAYAELRVTKREENIARKVNDAEWVWLYDRQTKSNFTANSKSEAEKIARLRAHQIGKRLVYVYVAAK